MTDQREDPPVLVFDEAEDEAGRMLRRARAILFRYPIASQAALRALVAEGRAFATTPEGAALAERLVRAELVQRARVVWEVATANAVTGDGEQLIPSAVLEALAAAAAQSPLEPWLARELERDHGG